ncbi:MULTISPECIES: HAD family hydrolase [unclassified Paenibacillus]|uniref:HAD family hydrolase n=1 Tax=unclassified Paenibacillus TaxID=185978 RepID=UPI0036392414
MKYVFFDLDETLSDHRYACQNGIEAIMNLYPDLRVKTVEQLETEFWQMLNGNYNQVLSGALSLKDTRLERIAALFIGCNLKPPEDLEKLGELYVSCYDQSFRAIPGIIEVLELLKEQDRRVTVITNGFKKTQYKKLVSCKVIKYIDHIITSEEIGVPKPHKQIFMEALRICNVSSEEVIMIGDSWVNDIMGASSLGIKTLWFNRRNESCPDSSITDVIYEPHEIIDYMNLKRR